MALNTHFLLSFSMLLLSLVVIASAYDPKSYLPKYTYEKPKLGDYILSKIDIGVQGLIYCKSGYKLIPIKGAVARITCQAEDKYGYTTETYTLTAATDSKGYFFAELFISQLKSGHKLKECKAYFELSPMEDCEVLTNVNKGTSGAPLSDYQYHEDKKMNIFSVGPWFCTPKKEQEEPKKEQEEPKKEQEEHKPISKEY